MQILNIVPNKTLVCHYLCNDKINMLTKKRKQYSLQ